MGSPEAAGSVPAANEYFMRLCTAERYVSTLDGNNHRAGAKVLNDTELGAGDETQG